MQIIKDGAIPSVGERTVEPSSPFITNSAKQHFPASDNNDVI